MIHLLFFCTGMASFHVSHRGTVLHLTDAQDGHVYSTWDAERNAPVPGCYTQLLEEALRSSAPFRHGNVSLLVLGLGAGVLPARLGDAVAWPVDVAELDLGIVAQYESRFRNATRSWAQSENKKEPLVALLHPGTDALASVAPSVVCARYDAVAVDIPPCYRDLTARCVQWVLAVQTRCPHVPVAVNLFFPNVERAAKKWSGSIRAQRNGNAVWM